MSRKIEDMEYVEASTSAATVLPGLPLPAWTHLGEPESTPEPEPAPEPASVMELVSVGAAVEQQGHVVGQPHELAASVPIAAELGAAPMTSPVPDAPTVASAGLIRAVGASVPDSLDAFAPPVAASSAPPMILPSISAPPLPAPPMSSQPMSAVTTSAPSTAVPSVPALAASAPSMPTSVIAQSVMAPSVPTFAAPVAPAPSFAPPVEPAGSEMSMLTGAMPAPEAFAPPSALPTVPAPPLPSPDLAAPIAVAPLVFSAPAPLVTSPDAGAATSPDTFASTATSPDTFADAAPEQAVGDIALDAAPMDDPTADAADTASGDDLDSAAKPSRRPLLLLLVLGVVAILGAVAAFVYPGLLVAHDDPAPVAPVTQQQPQAAPKTATLAVPATVAGLDTITGAPATALSAAASSTALSGFSTPVSAVYGKAGVPGATVIAWTVAPSSPAATITSAFAGFETASATAITDIAEVPITGGLSGQMSCGSGTVNAAPATVCFWADDTTFGAVTILKPATAKDGALTAVAVRQAVETLA